MNRDEAALAGFIGMCYAIFCICLGAWYHNAIMYGSVYDGILIGACIAFVLLLPFIIAREVN